MRHFLLTIFAVIGITLQAANIYNETDSIVMYYTDWSLLTDRNISCNEFYLIAQNKYVVSDKGIIKRCEDAIDSLEKYDPYSLDVRCKVLFYQDGNITTSLCMDEASVLYKGQLFKNDPKLLSIINNITLSFPCSTPQRNEYRKNVSIVIDGEEVVTKKVLQLLKKKGEKQKGFRLQMTCRIDAEGNTIDVTLPKCPTFINKKQASKIKDIIKDNIRWNYDEERSPSEQLFYSILIEE